MRIVSGKWKGRRFLAPKNLPTRPTTDFAKEALFNILNHRFFLNEIRVLDLFAGIGSISLEFASRGATEVFAVEQNIKCINFIESTIQKLESDQIKIYKSDVFSFLNRTSAVRFDVIFADPPFDLESDLYLKFINQIFENNWLEEEGLLIVEHSKNIDFSSHSQFLEEKKYGNVHFSFFE